MVKTVEIKDTECCKCHKKWYYANKCADAKTKDQKDSAKWGISKSHTSRKMMINLSGWSESDIQTSIAVILTPSFGIGSMCMIYIDNSNIELESYTQCFFDPDYYYSGPECSMINCSKTSFSALWWLIVYICQWIRTPDWGLSPVALFGVIFWCLWGTNWSICGWRSAPFGYVLLPIESPSHCA